MPLSGGVAIRRLGRGLPSEVGSKAWFLDRLLQAGLPVPPGWTVTLTAEDALPDLSAECDPAGLWAVRSSFPLEDGPQQSQAGRFLSLLSVPSADLNKAIRQVHASGDDAVSPRRTVLVQPMIAPLTAGVLFDQPDFLDPLVLFTEGTAEALVSGQEAGRSLELPPSLEGRPAAWRRLALEVRRALGPGNLGWDLEWADDGAVVWLLQARPITRAPLRDELFSYANIREIMPDPPSPFMASVVSAAGARLYGYYRKFDPSLPKHRPLLEEILGRPLFNISLLTETMRRWGLPTRLVTDQIGGADVAAQGWQPALLGRKLPVLARQAWAQTRAVATARKAIARLSRWTVEVPSGPEALPQLAQQTEDLFEHLVTVMLDLTAALALPLSLLRRWGTLEEHSARHRTPTGRILSDLEPLRALVTQHPDWWDGLRAGVLPANPEFQALWLRYLEQHGHRGFYESDLAQPRWVEAPQAVLASLLGPSPVRPTPRSGWRAWLSWPLWIYTRRLIDTRERWRDQAMKAYLELRRAILAQGAQLGIDPPERLFQLRREEWAALAQGHRPTAESWERRAQEQAELARYQVPDLVRRFEPRSHFLQHPELQLRSRVEGVPLVSGRVVGRVWKAQDARSGPPPETGEPWILLTRTVDPAWLLQLPCFSGAIVELGGDLSHGSILLRELGAPAITNAAGATSAFQGGEWVRLHGSEGFAERLNEAETEAFSHPPRSARYE